MIQIAIRAARAGGQELLKYFRKPQKIRERRAHNTIVGEADLKSEKAVIQKIQAKYPQHNIFSEERGIIKQDSDYTWVIDPLEGTSNYNSGIPYFGVSIGLVYQSEVILGVFYDPVHRDLFRAQRGKGAYWNNKRIKVSPNRSLRKTILVTAGKTLLLPKVLKAFTKVAKEVRTVRIPGATGLELCYLASGFFDAFFKPHDGIYDFLAASIILEEAGGRLTDLKGRKPKLDLDFSKRIAILATNAQVPHSKLLKALQ